jgi:hypothetical protein
MDSAKLYELSPAKEPSVSEILEKYENSLPPDDKVTIGYGKKTIEFYKTGKSENEVKNLKESIQKFINSEESDILNF